MIKILFFLVSLNFVFLSFNACSSDQFFILLLKHIIDKGSAISTTTGNDELTFIITNPTLLVEEYMKCDYKRNPKPQTEDGKRDFFNRAMNNLTNRKIIIACKANTHIKYSINLQQKLPINQEYLSNTLEWETLSGRCIPSSDDDGRGVMYPELRRSDVAYLFKGELDSWKNDLWEATSPTTHFKAQTPER